MTERYRIELECELDEEWTSWLGSLELTHSRAGHTILTGDLPDQTALHGLLARIRDLGLPLLSVTRLAADGGAKIEQLQ